MKFTIEGFSQAELVARGLDAIDAIILRWFVDFQNTGKMKRIVHNGEVFHWVQYQAVIDDLPCVGISNKESLGRRFQKLVKAEILNLVIYSVGGRFSYFAVNPIGFLPMVEQHSTQKSGLIDSSTNDSSTKIKNSEPKHRHGEFNHVLLTENELVRLKTDYPIDWQERITRLDEYIEMKGAKYANHNLTIRNWAKRDQSKEPEALTTEQRLAIIEANRKRLHAHKSPQPELEVAGGRY